jgi:hypothetical protein
MRVFVFILCSALAVGLIYSGATKALAPFAFLDAVLRYELVGPRIAIVVAAILPWLEIVCGVALLINRRTVVAGAWIAGALGLVFFGAQVSALARGLEIACGCVGGYSGEPIGAFSLLRAGLVLMAGAAIVVLSQAAESKRIAANSSHPAEAAVAG